VAASRTQVTSASNAGMSTLPQDKSYRNKTQEGMRERGGSQRYVGRFSSLFRLTQIGRMIFWSTKASVSCNNLSMVVTRECADSASSPTRL
jgi:hypothetical protein